MSDLVLKELLTVLLLNITGIKKNYLASGTIPSPSIALGRGPSTEMLALNIPFWKYQILVVCMEWERLNESAKKTLGPFIFLIGGLRFFGTLTWVLKTTK